MWLIKKLWYDSMENRNAFGYNAIAITKDQELVDALRKETIPVSDSPWPLQYVGLSKIKKDSVHRYWIVEIKEVTLKDMDTL